MPITYTIVPDSVLIMAKATGILTTKEIIAYLKRLASDPDCPPGAIEIVDFSEVKDFSINSSKILGITRKYESAKIVNKIPVTIFICKSDLQYGIGHTMQTLHETSNPEHIVLLVRSNEELVEIINKWRKRNNPD